jgi:hypothetical protein
MSPCLDCSTCFYCGRFLSPRHEHDHFPRPRRAGGLEIVAVCIDCHDLKDRFPLYVWPVHLLAPTFTGLQATEALELLVAVASTLPERYRARLARHDAPVAVRPFAGWTPGEMVSAVSSATTTEARLFLAKAVALALDAESATDPGPLGVPEPGGTRPEGPAAPIPAQSPAGSLRPPAARG